MSLVVSLLVITLLCGGVTVILYGLLSIDPTPSQSGALPALIFFGVAAIIFFVLTVVSWLGTIIIAVLT